jgi:hypothetical protein
MAGEAIAAEVRFGQAAILEQHAPRPVEHEDPLGCESAYLGGDVSAHTAL